MMARQTNIGVGGFKSIRNLQASLFSNHGACFFRKSGASPLAKFGKLLVSQVPGAPIAPGTLITLWRLNVADADSAASRPLLLTQ
jgi:hypothetical protein